MCGLHACAQARSHRHFCGESKVETLGEAACLLPPCTVTCCGHRFRNWLCVGMTGGLLSCRDNQNLVSWKCLEGKCHSNVRWAEVEWEGQLAGCVGLYCKHIRYIYMASTTMQTHTVSFMNSLAGCRVSPWIFLDGIQTHLGQWHALLCGGYLTWMT